MPIRIYTGSAGLMQMKASFKKNWKHYLQEAFGLAIFMFSACFFNVLLWGSDISLHITIENELVRNIVTGLLMGATALFIFYAPFTAPSGAQINPAVTITFLRLDKMCRYDALFYILFQLIGGLLAVYAVTSLMSNNTTAVPVKYAVTVPGKSGAIPAAITEYIIAIITMMMVLFTSSHRIFKKYTRIFAACFVCVWVILAGPLSGFGMNPARSFASALPSHIYTSFWIYITMPFAGMLTAAEFYLIAEKKIMGPATE
ncbi:MAG TPA: aquaporin [Panacibacter sp.]|nr:aquaporin [Panacibacter sp.]